MESHKPKKHSKQIKKHKGKSHIEPDPKISKKSSKPFKKSKPQKEQPIPQRPPKQKKEELKEAPTSITPTVMPKSAIQATKSKEIIRVTIGCYDGFIWIYEAAKIPPGATDWTIRKNKISENSLRTVTANSSSMAIGGFEERINVVHWTKPEQPNEEGFILEEHSGTITALKLYKNQYLLSAAEDNKICVWKMHPHLLFHTFKYKPQIENCIDLAVHPSGKILLSLHKNGYLLMWNLMTGHFEFEKKVDATGLYINFLGEGKYFYIGTKSQIFIYSIAKDEPISQLKIDNLNALTSIENAIYGVNTKQDKKILKWEISEDGKISEKAQEFDLSNKIKGKIKDISVALYKTQENNIQHYISAITSEQEICVLNVSSKATENPEIQILLNTKIDSRGMCTAISITGNK